MNKLLRGSFPLEKRVKVKLDLFPKIGWHGVGGNSLYGELVSSSGAGASSGIGTYAGDGEGSMYDEDNID